MNTDDQLRKLREALERSNAAMWDAHYGNGIDVAYAQNVDREVKAALASVPQPRD